MNNLPSIITEYLDYCHSQKCLDEKTLKAYRIDLRQFAEFLDSVSYLDISRITPSIVESYIGTLHSTYKPKTAKRKIASLKALFHYCEYKDIIERNPFSQNTHPLPRANHSPKDHPSYHCRNLSFDHLRPADLRQNRLPAPQCPPRCRCH